MRSEQAACITLGLVSADWKSEAVCRRLLDRLGDPDDPAVQDKRRAVLGFWFPVSKDRAPEGRRYCANCPVAHECLLEALTQSPQPRAGIFAGSSEKQRRQLRRADDREAAVAEFIAEFHRAFVRRPDVLAATFRHGTPEAFKFGCSCTLCSRAARVGAALCMAPARGRTRCTGFAVKGHHFCRWHLPDGAEELSA